MIQLGREETTSNLFSENVQYKVPHFQRRYVWDDTNWRTLSEDILAQLELKLEGDIDSDSGFDFKPVVKLEDTSTEKDKKHFTGIIVIREIGKGEPEIFEVIDGQQRLTTFQIILCVIRDIFIAKGKSTEAKEPQSLILNRSDDVKSYKLIPTKYDLSAFEKIVDETYGNLVSQSDLMFNNEFQESVRLQLFSDFDDNIKVSHDILNVYNYFYKWIWDYVQENIDINLSNLLSKIRTQFLFVRLRLDEEKYSEEIFESLNATGRKLSNFDYLRNNLFLRAGKLGVDKKSGKSYSAIFYDKYWLFENDEQVSHYWKTDKQKAFLRAFLIANLGPYCFKTENVNPLDVYRKYSRTAGGIKNEFKQLMKYAESYQKLKQDIDDPNKPIHRYVQLCSDLSLNCLEPLLLFVKHKNGDDAVDHVCKILESYLVRLILCFGNKQDTNDASYKCIKYFFDKAVGIGTFDVEEFKQFLSGSGKLKYELEGSGGKVWPDNKQIKKALEQVGNKDSYLMYYMFKRMEHYSHEENHTPWEYSPPTLDEQSNFLEQLQKGRILENFNTLWEPPLE
ncbi:MAG: DUF262 domain-containing protein [Candidatus Poribacteria bacterium]|nr:DUF262 domain-containing protein [Candidatus Poribacteria bacterium]